MNTTFDFKSTDDQAIVYVRPVSVEDLPDGVKEQAQGLKTIYAVHNAEGEQLALVKDRALAYVLARQHDMNPVAVH
jgi:hypothetical protein